MRGPRAVINKHRRDRDRDSQTDRQKLKIVPRALHRLTAVLQNTSAALTYNFWSQCWQLGTAR